MKRKKVLRLVALMLFIGMVALGASQIVRIEMQYKKDRDVYTEIKEQYTTAAPEPARRRTERNTEEIAAAPKETPSGFAPAVDAVIASEASNQAVIVDFQAIREEVTPDVVAWISCSGTQIDYPVVQGKDNEYFLDHNVKGVDSPAGAIFIDAANYADFSDVNTIIHGHHIKDGSMFGSLSDWSRQSYFDKHNVFVISTDDKKYTVQMIAYYVAAEGSDAFRIDFSGDEDIQQWLDWIYSQASVHRGYTYHDGDRFVSLVTCNYRYDTARSILIGRIIE